jgi:peptidoglycan hydrolase-like protein with peptidoglycan-binding domain
MLEWIAGLNTPPNESGTGSSEGLETTEEEANASASKVNVSNPPPPNLKSPLFKQHMRLRTLAMLADDRFVKGSNGAGVFAIQQALKKLYPKAEIGKYGIYGKETIALVKKFQKEEGLGSDGDFGQQTLLALDQYSFPRVVIEEGGEASLERVDGFDVKEELHRPAKISATANDLPIAQGQETLEHQDKPEDKGIHHNQDISGVRIYSDPTKNSKLKFTLNYDTDVTLVGEYAYESSWSLIQTSDGKEGWINSDYVTQGTTAIAANLAQSDLTMIGEEQNNLGEVVQNRYGSSFVKEQDARLIIHAIASLNDGRMAMYYKEETHELSWWERWLLNANAEDARSIYQNIGIRSGMNLLLPSEDLIFQMRDAGLISSGSTGIDVQGAIDFLKMSGGFGVGILEGLWDGLVGTLKAIPDLLKMIWDVAKSAVQGELFAKIGEIISSIWEFIKNLPQTADAWWQAFKEKSPFEQGKDIGNGVGMIAFEVILGVLTGGAVNALKATGVGAKIMAASSKIHNKIGHFGDGLADVSRRMLNDVGDVVLPESVLGLDGKKYPVKRNDLMDNDRPQNMKMDGDKDGGGKKPEVRDANATKELSNNIPAKWKKNLKCKEYAKALISKLKAKNIKGELLEIRTGTGFIQSDEFGSIATNGIHQAVKVGDTVFDNLHPNGIKYDDWIKDLGGKLFTNPPHALITPSSF